MNLSTYGNWPWMFPGGLYLHTVYFEAGPSITAPLSSVTPDLQPTIAQAT